MRSEDIAKLAGVSRSTVSRVINNYSNVPEETRAKVLKVIEQHQYEPNSFARALAGKKTDTIGLFAISMNEKENATRIYQNNYFAPFVDAVVDTANARGRCRYRPRWSARTPTNTVNMSAILCTVI